MIYFDMLTLNEPLLPPAALAGIVLGATVWFARCWVRSSRLAPSNHLVPRLSLIRLFLWSTAIGLVAPALAHARQIQDSSRRHGARLPWLVTGEYPPPRLPVRAKDPLPQPATREVIRAGQNSSENVPSSLESQVGRNEERRDLAPLFPRVSIEPNLPDRSQAEETKRASTSDPYRIERVHAMLRHPAGKGTHIAKTHHTVMPGDTLWGIAGEVLATTDMRRIARYWPLIHRENRDVIGADPNLLRPGQVLTLPRIER